MVCANIAFDNEYDDVETGGHRVGPAGVARSNTEFGHGHAVHQSAE